MNSKTILGILLLLSMIFVLYAPVTTLIDIQTLIGKSAIVSSAVIKARDNLLLQITGSVFLYLALAFAFNFIRFAQQETLAEPQESKPAESQQVNPTKLQQIIETRAIKPKTLRVVKPLTNKTKNIIAVLSASVFMLVFVWQVFSNMPNTTMDFDIPMFFIEQAMKGIIAFLIVGIVAYYVAKYH